MLFRGQCLIAKEGGGSFQTKPKLKTASTGQFSIKHDWKWPSSQDEKGNSVFFWVLNLITAAGFLKEEPPHPALATRFMVCCLLRYWG